MAEVFENKLLIFAIHENDFKIKIANLFRLNNRLLCVCSIKIIMRNHVSVCSKIKNFLKTKFWQSVQIS